jgi:iron complex transport system permease protein
MEGALDVEGVKHPCRLTACDFVIARLGDKRVTIYSRHIGVNVVAEGRHADMRAPRRNHRECGLDVNRLRRRSFLLVAALTAGAVCFTGTIGFVGLIAPHIARATVGEDHRFALPTAALMGAVILVAASVIGKLISPGAVIPVGIITAIAGIPMLMAVILTLKPMGAR